MAQIRESRQRWSVRLALYMRQRPVIAVIGACLALLVVFAAGAGVSRALGSAFSEKEDVIIERAGSNDTADDPGASADGEDLDRSAVSGGTDRDGAAEGLIVVDVAGAVAAPSVVTLAEGARVGDAIEAAGGFAGDADTALVNRAARLQDGQQVFVPRQGEESPAASASSVTPSATTGSQAGSDAGTPVNINLAGVDELDTLPGVGPSTARAIVEDRETNGPFRSIEDLMRVSGIGEKKFQNLENSICV